MEKRIRCIFAIPKDNKYSVKLHRSGNFENNSNENSTEDGVNMESKKKNGVSVSLRRKRGGSANIADENNADKVASASSANDRPEKKEIAKFRGTFAEGTQNSQSSDDQSFIEATIEGIARTNAELDKETYARYRIAIDYAYETQDICEPLEAASLQNLVELLDKTGPNYRSGGKTAVLCEIKPILRMILSYLVDINSHKETKSPLLLSQEVNQAEMEENGAGVSEDTMNERVTLVPESSNDQLFLSTYSGNKMELHNSEEADGFDDNELERVKNLLETIQESERQALLLKTPELTLKRTSEEDVSESWSSPRRNDLTSDNDIASNAAVKSLENVIFPNDINNKELSEFYQESDELNADEDDSRSLELAGETNVPIRVIDNFGVPNKVDSMTEAEHESISRAILEKFIIENNSLDMKNGDSKTYSSAEEDEDVMELSDELDRVLFMQRHMVESECLLLDGKRRRPSRRSKEIVIDEESWILPQNSGRNFPDVASSTEQDNAENEELNLCREDNDYDDDFSQFDYADNSIHEDIAMARVDEFEMGEYSVQTILPEEKFNLALNEKRSTKSQDVCSEPRDHFMPLHVEMCEEIQTHSPISQNKSCELIVEPYMKNYEGKVNTENRDILINLNVPGEVNISGKRGHIVFPFLLLNSSETNLPNSNDTGETGVNDGLYLEHTENPKEFTKSELLRDKMTVDSNLETKASEFARICIENSLSKLNRGNFDSKTNISLKNLDNPIGSDENELSGNKIIVDSNLETIVSEFTKMCIKNSLDRLNCGNVESPTHSFRKHCDNPTEFTGSELSKEKNTVDSNLGTIASDFARICIKNSFNKLNREHSESTTHSSLKNSDNLTGFAKIESSIDNIALDSNLEKMATELVGMCIKKSLNEFTPKNVQSSTNIYINSKSKREFDADINSIRDRSFNGKIGNCSDKVGNTSYSDIITENDHAQPTISENAEETTHKQARVDIFVQSSFNKIDNNQKLTIEGGEKTATFNFRLANLHGYQCKINVTEDIGNSPPATEGVSTNDDTENVRSSSMSNCELKLGVNISGLKTDLKKINLSTSASQSMQDEGNNTINFPDGKNDPGKNEFVSQCRKKNPNESIERNSSASTFFRENRVISEYSNNRQTTSSKSTVSQQVSKSVESAKPLGKISSLCISKERKTNKINNSQSSTRCRSVESRSNTVRSTKSPIEVANIPKTRQFKSSVRGMSINICPRSALSTEMKKPIYVNETSHQLKFDTGFLNRIVNFSRWTSKSLLELEVRRSKSSIPKKLDCSDRKSNRKDI